LTYNISNKSKILNTVSLSYTNITMIMCRRFLVTLFIMDQVKAAKIRYSFQRIKESYPVSSILSIRNSTSTALKIELRPTTKRLRPKRHSKSSISIITKALTFFAEEYSIFSIVTHEMIHLFNYIIRIISLWIMNQIYWLI